MPNLKRSFDNPIIKPRKGVWWERESTFNPGVIKDGDEIKMLYRAVGDDFVSRLGYASSLDGINFSRFSDLPVFEPDPRNQFETLGCEDPRIAKIGDTYYITYCGASLNSPIKSGVKVSPFAGSGVSWRVRVSMARTGDFKHFERFGAILPDFDSKDAALFPEKIQDRYFLLHRIWPDINLASSSDLKNWENHQVIMSPREGLWDCRNIGAGTVPVKTPRGWLIIYHGVDYNLVYRLGIVVLDLMNPEKVIYRSSEPIMSPEREFERSGHIKNVVFTCGMVEKDGQFYIYYGAADSCIGVATVDKNKLLHEIAGQIRAKHRRLLPIPSLINFLGSRFNGKN